MVDDQNDAQNALHKGRLLDLEKAFWEEKWKAGQIGANQTEPNPFLLKHYSALNPPKNSHILVPLCGKTIDMRWIASQGNRVTGIEFARDPINGFFREGGLTPKIETNLTGFQIHSSPPFRIFEGDFFQVLPGEVGPIDWIYDRAALVALPPSTQPKYVEHLARFLKPGGQIFLISYDYNESEMEGPPFSTPPSRVHELYDDAFTVELLETAETLSIHPTLLERGLKSYLNESVYRLRRPIRATDRPNRA